jgi:hypothetical protein
MDHMAPREGRIRRDHGLAAQIQEIEIEVLQGPCIPEDGPAHRCRDEAHDRVPFALLMIPSGRAPRPRASRRSRGCPRPRIAPGPLRRRESDRPDLPGRWHQPRSAPRRSSTRSSGRHTAPALPPGTQRDAPGTGGDTPVLSSRPRPRLSAPPFQMGRRSRPQDDRLPSTVSETEAVVKTGRPASSVSAGLFRHPLLSSGTMHMIIRCICPSFSRGPVRVLPHLRKGQTNSPRRLIYPTPSPYGPWIITSPSVNGAARSQVIGEITIWPVLSI